MIEQINKLFSEKSTEEKIECAIDDNIVDCNYKTTMMKDQDLKMMQ